MRLLELTREFSPSVGGLEKFVSDRCAIYQGLGIDYTILSTDFTTEKAGIITGNDQVTVLRQYSPYNITPSLRKHLRDDYDVVSINLLGRYYSDYSIMHYRNRRQKIILTPFFAYHTNSHALVKSFVVRKLFPVLLKHVDALVVFSQCEADFWQEQCRFPAERIYKIPPYIDQTDEVPDDTDHSEPFILYLGRAGGNKKTDLLLRSFLKLNKTQWRLSLTIRPQDVEEQIRTQVLQNRHIRLLGNVTEVQKGELLQQCSALIFPTTWESFGYVAFEASLYKKPLLCSEIPLLRELHDERGVIFFRNAEDDIVDAVERFTQLSLPGRSAMGEHNFKNAQRFTFRRAADQYSQLFSQIK